MTPMERWNTLISSGDVSSLPQLLADEVCFYSPVVHTPQRGKAITTAYLQAAFSILMTPSFRYVNKIDGGNRLSLEFVTEIDGIEINGVDLISCNDDGQITEFKVMIRPLKAINLVHQKMAELLQASAATR
ncbi:nuclear transport factor 2 family protein [Ferrimonas sp. SCSIO 43195]|uniref:nuclear transport factor 2 family protein n=1 Tax=Ferrimonas sp. SCSIO 43195 TaxID=2822844 RepID=UPI0020759716|nr:nuclear transport factor 2 family protein [Ferrimonas sp. SCSIO 43195]USD35814.1 nuclear transport factor 2 family protein [Ferrimonas sp. SCSIO 43195]